MTACAAIHQIPAPKKKVVTYVIAEIAEKKPRRALQRFLLFMERIGRTIIVCVIRAHAIPAMTIAVANLVTGAVYRMIA